MKKKLLRNIGVLILSAALLAVSGCGDKETDNVPVTEETEAAEPETEATELPEETEEPTEAVEPETETETEQEVEYTVTDMSATKYAKSSVNVRKGPSSDYDQLGSLSTNQQVTVTGQADTGWYRIEFNGEEGYVSDKYLVDEKVAVNASGADANAATGTNNPSGTNSTSGSNSNSESTSSSDTNGASGSAGNSSGTYGSDNSNSGDTGSSTNANVGSADNTGSAGTDTGNTGADAGSSDTGSTGTVIDASGLSPEELAELTGIPIGETGGGENAGIGGDTSWYE